MSGSPHLSHRQAFMDIINASTLAEQPEEGLLSSTAQMPVFMNRWSSFFLLTLLTIGALRAQEICNNAIDDDLDGLTDLNDTTDCVCNGYAGNTEVESIIPNASFEETDCLPPSYGYMDCASGWDQATSATSDFFYNGSYMPYWIEQPLPGGGNGCVGGYICPDYTEYIGACLPAPLETGVSYSLQTDVLGVMQTADLTDTVLNTLGPVDITIWGYGSCPGQLPISTCPETSGWTAIAVVNYQPTSSWDVITFTFTPTFDVFNIMIGGPCNMPPSYPSVGNMDLAYFLYDELVLNTTASFGSTVGVTGQYYNNDLVLTGDVDSLATDLQWYFEGVAIPGQTSAILDISALGLDTGCYQLYSVLDTACDIATVCINPLCVTPIIGNVALSGCVPYNAAFANGSDMPNVQTVEWDFGDGSATSSATNPTHLYTEPGTYSVSLSLTSTDLCPTDTTYTALVTVHAFPEPSFTSDVTEGCVGMSVAFTNTTDTLSGACAWDFGDGTPDSFNCSPSHVYTTAGLFSVSLTVTSPNGCVADTVVQDLILVYGYPAVTFTADTIEGCSPTTITFTNATPANQVGSVQWDLGNGNTSTAMDEITTVYPDPGSYNVSLSVTAPGGCQADTTYADLITVYGHPVVELLATPDSGCYPLEIAFVNATDPAFTGTCIWDFGDGDTSDVCSPYHTYFDPGVYTARLHVISQHNCVGDTAEVDITVYEHPTAGFVFGPQPTDIFKPFITFTDSSSSDVVAWDWSFGEGGVLGNSIVEHPALNFPGDVPGIYPVRLIVTNANTCQDTMIAFVEIDGYYAVWAPNAFTPDGDGINDEWRPLIRDHKAEQYRLQVFDRWGQEIWASNDPSQGWPGTEGSTGLFTWKLNTRDAISGIDHEYTGHVTVLR